MTNDAPQAGKWVPLEPTKAMIEEAMQDDDLRRLDDQGLPRRIYRAMLAASIAPTHAEPVMHTRRLWDEFVACAGHGVTSQQVQALESLIFATPSAAPTVDLAGVLEALEIGRDSAQAEAEQYHATFKGYKPARHSAMDADVAKIDAAITTLRAAITQPAPAAPADLQRQIDECAPFLKEGETPAECIARNRKDAQAVFLYYDDAHRWRWVRDHWDDIGAQAFPQGGHHPSWTAPSDPTKLTAYVDKVRAALTQPGQHTHADPRLERAQRSMDAKFSSAITQPAPAAAQDAQDAARLKAVLETFGKREDNMPLTNGERHLLAAFDDRGSYTLSMKLSAIDAAIAQGKDQP